jgi:2'-5' RNA ligase
MMPRLFVALEFPEEVLDALAGLRPDLRGVKPEARDQLHLTLRFLGEVEGGLLPAARAALGRVRAAPFALELAGVGCFNGDRGTPRFLYARVAPSDDLRALAGRIEEALADLPLRKDPLPFNPHVTLARLDGVSREAAGRFVTDRADFRAGPFPVTHFALFSSARTPSGPAYSREESFDFSAPPPPGFAAPPPPPSSGGT